MNINKRLTLFLSIVFVFLSNKINMNSIAYAQTTEKIINLDNKSNFDIIGKKPHKNRLTKSFNNIEQYNSNNSKILSLTNDVGRKPHRNESGRDFELCVWLTTVKNLDWPKSKDPVIQQQELKDIIKNLHSMGITKIFFQVRTRGDALYKSLIFPWSIWLTGEFDKDPGYDPLKLCIDECKKYGIKCEAWINPFLIGKNNLGYDKNNYISHLRGSDLDPDSLKNNPDWLAQFSDQGYILNIGEKKVRELVVREAEYICKNYDVSGIHIDDYFYPYPSKDTNNNYDISTYNDYKEHAVKTNQPVMTLEDWRRDNVNEFIKSMYDSLKSLNKTFSISPFGIWKNVKNTKGNGKDTNGLESYESIGCDSKKWVENKWANYFIPQLYWERGFDKADFITLSDWWNDLFKNVNKNLSNNNKVKLLFGLAAYRIDENATKECWKNANEIKEQIEIAKKLDNVSGVSFFRYENLQKHPECLEF